MEALEACPHHGFDIWLLVSYFYDGISPAMKQLLETICVTTRTKQYKFLKRLTKFYQV